VDQAAGIPTAVHLRVHRHHKLRHTYASTLLAGGVDIRTVSAALGHHDPAFTLRTYSHLIGDADDRIRAALDRSPGGHAGAASPGVTAAPQRG
jgi:site-specific recombinase XerD